jgi:hypothetical protein
MVRSVIAVNKEKLNIAHHNTNKAHVSYQINSTRFN